MNCPKCKNVTLRSRDVEHLSSCPVCGGIWLGKEHHEKLQEMIDFDSGGHKKPEHDAKTGLCPDGHGILIRAKVNVEPAFYLEKCPSCNGIWFDKGEWQKIVEHRIEDNLIDLWSLAWQRQQRKQQQEQDYERGNIEALGSDLSSRIKALAKEINQHPNRYRAILLLNEELQKASSASR